MRNKGVHVLFEALRDVDAKAVVVGFGDYREELERLAPPRTLFTGPLEHRHLAKLIPLADVTAVPSIFPEAFGMVAAEAAAAGSLPLVANHSGLAEIATGVSAEYPDRYRDLTSFTTGDSAELAEKLRRLLTLAPDERAGLQEAARRAVVERWSWAGVARRLLEPFS
jgi:glycosyltransferase involved in cell wall biosynthesis